MPTNDDIIRNGGGSPQARMANERQFEPPDFEPSDDDCDICHKRINDCECDVCKDCGRLVEQCQCPDKKANI
jgi:hypothetical protein